MTIYTDQVTGEKYDRCFGGVAATPGSAQGYKPCSECAFSEPWKDSDACARARKHCVSAAHNKTVFFVFKERKA